MASLAKRALNNIGGSGDQSGAAVATARIIRDKNGGEKMTAAQPKSVKKEDDDDESEASLAKRALAKIKAGQVSEED